MMDALRDVLTPWLGKLQWKQSDGRITFVYRINPEDTPSVPLKLKVETNTREHFSVYGLQNVPFRVNSRWFEGACNIQTYALSYTDFCYTMLELVSATYFSEGFLRKALRRTTGPPSVINSSVVPSALPESMPIEIFELLEKGLRDVERRVRGHRSAGRPETYDVSNGRAVWDIGTGRTLISITQRSVRR